MYQIFGRFSGVDVKGYKSVNGHNRRTETGKPMHPIRRDRP